MASEAYHDWSGEAADAQLRVNFSLKLLLSQNFCNRPLMRFISFASNIGPAAAVPAGPAPSPLPRTGLLCFSRSSASVYYECHYVSRTEKQARAAAYILTRNVRIQYRYSPQSSVDSPRTRIQVHSVCLRISCLLDLTMGRLK